MCDDRCFPYKKFLDISGFSTVSIDDKQSPNAPKEKSLVSEAFLVDSDCE
jgi:hypothetical protein